MKSMIWKELRENTRWAVAGLVAVGVVLIAAVSPHLEGFRVRFVNHPVLVSEGVLLGLGFSSAGLGLLLGFLQVFRESRGDRWALLVHRPLSRSRIFLAKTVTGLALYLVAVSLPFSLLAAWVATPGHVPEPFSPRMVLPGLALIAAGPAYYFAGALTARREARWYGSRALGVAGAFLASVATALPYFWMALVSSALVTGVLALAAWGSFVAGGRYGPQPRSARTALGATLLSAITLIIGVGVPLLAIWLFPRDRSRYTYTYHTVDRQGRVLRVTLGAGSRIVEVTGPEGEPIDDYEGVQSLDEHLSPGAGLSIDRPEGSMEAGYHYWRSLGIVEITRFREGWFFVEDERLIHVYEARTGRRIGYVGPEQLRVAPEKPRTRFPESVIPRRLDRSGVLVFREAVYHVVPEERRLAKIFSTAPDDPVVDAGEFRGDAAGELAVATRSRIHVVSTAGAPIVSVERAEGTREWLRVIRLDGDRYALWYNESPHGLSSGEKTLFQVVSRDGTVESERLVSGLVPRRPDDAGPDIAAGLAMPILFHALVATVDAWWLSGDLATAGRIFFRVWPLILVLAAICAWAAQTLAGRLGSSPRRRVLWAGLGFLLGVPGLLTLACLEERPAREACASCGRARLVSRGTCERCGSGWPAPVPDGTEIFA